MPARLLDDDARILSHLPRVRRLAAHLSARTRGNVEADELLGAGLLGLIDAAHRFDERRGVPFDAFVGARVRGAMLDVLREGDPLGRRARHREREAAEAERKRPAAHADVGELPSDLQGPFDEVVRAQLSARLRRLIEEMPRREQLVLSLYYGRELTYREIGAVLGVTVSRVCQILRAIHERLREQLDAATLPI